MRHRHTKVVLIIMVIIVLAVGTYLFIIYSANGKPARKSIPNSQPVAASLSQEESTIDAFGSIITKDVYDIYIDFPATILKVHVTEGQKITYSQILVTLDLAGLHNQISQKELELESVRLEIEKNLQNLNEANQLFSKAKQDLVNREIELQREKTEVISMELKQLKDKLSRDFMKGNGIVSNLHQGVVYDIGYSAGDPLNIEKKLLSIVDLAKISVSADVPEEFIKDVKIGAGVTINPVADNSREYRGKVTKIAGVAVKRNGETVIPVEISIDNPGEGFLRPNFNVDVKITK